jgi:hypothetical protein
MKVALLPDIKLINIATMTGQRKTMIDKLNDAKKLLPTESNIE